MIENIAQNLLNKSDEQDLDPNKKQGWASDPMSSVWVGASAGTGKTKVLTDRVLRLMLPRIGEDDRVDQTIASATPPDRILCITFTKAAAAEMAERISKTLSEWSVTSEEELFKNLQSLTGYPPNKMMMKAARRLFARVVDVPGGMKIMTIHSFCQSILKRFPLEAGLPPHFEVMDDRTSIDYMTQCQHSVIRAAAEQPESELERALKYLTGLLQAEDMAKLLSSLAQERVRLARIFKVHGGYEKTVEAVYKTLGLETTDNQTNVLHPFCNNLKNEGDLRRACAALAEGTKTDLARADDLQDWLDGSIEKRVATFKLYQNVFLTAGGDVRKRLATASVVKTCPDILDVLEQEALRVINMADKVKAVQVAVSSAALLKIGSETLTRYQKRKDLGGLLDYDDLIYRTRDLLTAEGQAAWVLYKLDRGVDHILIDEAQDTNPEQWQVISSLVKEFFAGKGARDDTPRSLFVVGDDKQSIFSFQRADPAEFHRMRRYFENLVTTANEKWHPVDMDISFRSAPAVLEIVDSVFAQEIAREGVVFARAEDDGAEGVHHVPFRRKQAGLVELWPLFFADKTEELAPWALPKVQDISQSPSVKLADKIAETIKDWIDDGVELEASGKKIDAGDVMILVRNRGPFVEQMVRALKTREIAVSGVDRMVLNEQLPVMDLLALAEFLLLPEDDLALATVLKTPLIGMDEETLFDLAHGRSGSLWQALKKQDNDATRYLSKLLQTMRSTAPYPFFSEILNTPCPADKISGKRAFLSRLGRDVLDALDELLNACLEFETLHTPSLQAFLHWFTKGSAQIKRQQDPENTRQVRIMTVHGSKGLQAPIVFLPDTVSIPRQSKNRPRLLWPENKEQAVPLWVPRQDMEAKTYKARRQTEEQKQDQEYRRLLYVALTRAEDRLYVCGQAGKKKSIPDGCWYDLVAQAMHEKGDKVDFLIDGNSLVDEETDLTRNAYRFENGEGGHKEIKQNQKQRFKKQPLPDWARRLPNAEPMPPKPLTPSRPSEEEPAMRAPLEADDGYKFKRGILAHQLLEVLPTVPKEKQLKAAMTYLSRPCHDLTEFQANELSQEIVKVLNHPDFAPIFGEGSQAEVPIVGLVNEMKDHDAKIISGAIDRMVVTKDSVLIVDYKTNRPPPTEEVQVQKIYLKQMAAYRAAMMRIYPDKEIRCALLWTDGPNLMELSSIRLDDYSI